MNYSLHLEASQDLDDAAAYYQKQAGNILSQAFLSEFEHAVERLLRHPLLGSLWRNNKRKFVMPRFPYSIIYTVSNNELRIFDWIACPITSNPYADDRAITLAESEFVEGGLRRVSYLRPGKLFTCHESLPVDTVGLLNKTALQQARTAVIQMIQGS